MTLVTLVAEIARWTLLIAAGLSFIRLAIGPSTADRAVVLDLLSVLTAAFAGLTAIVTGLDAYLDVAAAIALAGFLATLAFARHIARQGAARASERAAVQKGEP